MIVDIKIGSSTIGFQDNYSRRSKTEYEMMIGAKYYNVNRLFLLSIVNFSLHHIHHGRHKMINKLRRDQEDG